METVVGQIPITRDDRDSGFDVVSGLFSTSETESLLEALASSPRTRAGARHLMSNERVAELARDRRLVDLASAALGSAARPFRATLFDKSPASNWLVVWHQDTALPLRQRFEARGWGPWSTKGGILYAHAPASALREVVALRLHLDDSTVGNGPLRVIPGSHVNGVLSDAELADLAGREQPFDCIVARGGVLVMRPLLVHASSKALVGSPRRVLHLEYASTFAFGSRMELQIA